MSTVLQFNSVLVFISHTHVFSIHNRVTFLAPLTFVAVVRHQLVTCGDRPAARLRFKVNYFVSLYVCVYVCVFVPVYDVCACALVCLCVSCTKSSKTYSTILPSLLQLHHR